MLEVAIIAKYHCDKNLLAKYSRKVYISKDMWTVWFFVMYQHEDGK